MPNKEQNRELYPKVEDMYNGKSVLITGAAGFVGMIILETLLRTCPGIISIYILIREKKGVKPPERKEKLFQKVIFNRLKEDQPDVFGKVQLVPGDVSKPDLGMSSDDVNEVIQNVSIVFHCAADISFVKPLKILIGVNALGTHYVVELCKKLKEIEVLVYTSTICSNFNRKVKIEEEIYRLPFPSERFIQEFKNGTDESIAELVAQCQPHWPNGYTFTKCLSENILLENASVIPCTIIRPSLVGSIWKTPHPGFCERNSTLLLMCEAAGKGFVKVLLLDPGHHIDFVPVDVVANCHIVAAWKVVTGRSKAPFTVNCSCYGGDQQTYREFSNTMLDLSKTHPVPNCFRTPTDISVVGSVTQYQLLTFYEHYVPAYVIDFLLKLSGKKFRLVPLYKLFDKAMITGAFFTTVRTSYHTDNFQTLEENLDEGDKKKFYTDISDLVFEDIVNDLPRGNAAFDWSTDKRTKEERMKKAKQRQQFSTFIKYAFLIIMFTIIYLITSKTCQLVGIM